MFFDMTTYKYSLQKYTGRNSRYTCPKCGRPHCFTLYVDMNNQPIAPDVGRCEHRNSCGYEKTPKMYFEEHPNEPKSIIEIKPQQKEEIKTDYIPFSLIQQSESLNNTLIDYLKKYFTMDALQNVAKAYHLGSTNKREVIFPQIDKFGNCRTGKVMQYGIDGHRIKGKTDAIDWLHSRLMKKQGKTVSDFHLKQCLFGEHLLRKRPNDLVCLVEGEKSAIICALVFPQYVWLSCGGLYGLNTDRCQSLARRNVLVYADANATEEWNRKIKLLSYCNSIKLSEWAKDEAPDSKRDIADLIMAERTPLARATTIGDVMQWMKELEITKERVTFNL